MAVTTEQVQTVSGVSSDVSLYLTSATNFLTAEFPVDDVDATTLDLITLYLAAHLVVLTSERGGQRREKMGEADESYRVPGDKDTGLAQTRFGQMALMFDTTGTLAGLSANKGLKALFSVV